MLIDALVKPKEMSKHAYGYVLVSLFYTLLVGTLVNTVFQLRYLGGVLSIFFITVFVYRYLKETHPKLKQYKPYTRLVGLTCELFVGSVIAYATLKTVFGQLYVISTDPFFQVYFLVGILLLCLLFSTIYAVGAITLIQFAAIVLVIRGIDLYVISLVSIMLLIAMAGMMLGYAGAHFNTGTKRWKEIGMDAWKITLLALFILIILILLT